MASDRDISVNLVINGLSSYRGGSATYLANLLRYAPCAEGLNVYLLAPSGVSLPVPPHVRFVHPRWPTRNPLLRAVWELIVLPVLLRVWRADILFCPGGLVGLGIPARCKVATMFRNSMPFDGKLVASLPWDWVRIRVLLLRPLYLRSLAKADLVIFVSEFGKAIISQFISVKRGRVIYHGTDGDFRTFADALPWPHALNDHERYILYVSEFSPYKNQLSVAHAYAALPEDLRRKFKLVFAGNAEGRDAEAVRAFVGERDLDSNILVLGDVPHATLPALYHHAEVILFASSCENCPNILIEALGAGRPLICSKDMPMPEIGGESLHYFSATDPDDLVHAIVTVLRDPAYARALAVAAAERSTRFDARQSIAQAWEEIFGLSQAP